MKSIAIIALGLAVPAAAQPQEAPKGLAQADFQARRTAELMEADGDRDGRLSAAEWAAARADGGKAGRDPSRRFARLDRNGDNYVDRPEIEALIARSFARMDKDGDGILTRPERAAHRDARRQRD